MSLAIGSTLEDFYGTWNKKVQNLVKPQIVQSGPSKDVMLVGDQVDVTRLPIHRYYQQDAGRYITNALMVVKDPETGIRNLSFSRTQLVDKVTLRNSMHSRGHQWMIYGKAERMNKNLEVAIVIGGTASSRQAKQRLGRVLRKSGAARAVLYEIVCIDTNEENRSRRRRASDAYQRTRYRRLENLT